MQAKPRPGRIRGRVLVPGSKSIAQRALVLATRRGGTVRNVPDNEDVARLCDGLRALGYDVAETPGERTVSGGFHDADVSLDLGDNATAARCLLALASLRAACTSIDGSPRLRRRPVAPLCRALRELGATVEGDEFPVRVSGPIRGGTVRLSTETSSQFASALILLLDRVPGLRVGVDGKHSFSYVTLTVQVQRTFSDPFTVEPDFSSAAALAVAAATTAGDLVLPGLSLSSPQPDARIALFLNRAGARVAEGGDGVRVRGPERGGLRGLRADVQSCPDLAPALGALGALAEGETIVYGAPHLVHKESDRIASTAAMLRAVGADVEELPDGIRVRGGTPLRAATVDSVGDHRIAMAAGVLALSVPGVTVTGAEAVAKSYPGFFDVLESLTE